MGALSRSAHPLPPTPVSLQFHKPNAVSTAGTRPALSLLNNWTYCSKRLCSLSFLFLVWREKQRKERRGGPRELVFFLATPGVLSHMVTDRISYHCGGGGRGSQLGGWVGPRLWGRSCLLRLSSSSACVAPGFRRLKGAMKADNTVTLSGKKRTGKALLTPSFRKTQCFQMFSLLGVWTWKAESSFWF